MLSALADLHTHSSRSDGIHAPADVMRLAHEAGLGWLALTDHDSLAGIEEARSAAARLGIQLIVGVELSVREVDSASGRKSDDHLLGWFVDPAGPALQAYLEGLQAGRVQAARDTLDILARLSMPLAWERVLELAHGAVVTRPHIARAMVERGYVPTERDAFDRYLGSGKPAAPERPSPTPQQAIAVVGAAGGVAGWAHPVFGQEADWPERLAEVPRRLDRLQEQGLVALECSYPDATPEIRERLLQWTRERGLIPTGGSDYHGPGKAPHAPIGHSAVDSAVVEALQAARR